MDFAFLNAILRSKYFPPSDPWLSGHSIPYYYFGHLIVAILTKLTGIPSSITFNLAAALVAALIAIGGFGIVYNLVAVTSSRRRAVLFGLVGVLFLAVLSNLEGVFELMAAHGVGSRGFYGLLDINGLDGPGTSDAWYPTQGWWWGRAQTLSSAWDSHHFPFVGILLGGIHAEYIVMPFELLVMAVALSLLFSGDPLDHRFLRKHTLRFCLIALLLGSLVVLDSWSFPAFAFFVVGAVVVRNYLADGRLRLSTLLRTGAFVVPLLALAVLLFLPLYLDLPAGVGGPRFVEMAFRPVGWPPESTVTRPNHFLLYFLTLLWIPGSFGAFCLLRSRGLLSNRRDLLLALLPVLLIVGVWSAGMIVRRHTGFFDELTARRGAWITFLMTASLLTIASMALLGALRGASRGQVQLGLLFALVAAAVGISLILGVDFFWVRVRDAWQNRTPTTFRLSVQAWVFLALAAAYGLHFMLANWRPRRMPARLAGSLWLAASVVVITAGLVYPVISTFARTNGFSGYRTLDGLAVVERFEAQEYEAILWLNSSVHGTPVILEAAGPEYGPFGRISARTGLPTLIGWPSHEYKFRGSWDPQAGRKEAVERLYTTTDLAEARAVLDQYDVTYVYVGPLERQQYDGPGLSKFARFMDVVFQNQEVTIYKMTKEDLEARVR
jgi:YYY domain-containing protein